MSPFFPPQHKPSLILRSSSVTSSTARSPPALRTHPYSSPVDLATSVPVTFNCAHSADGRRRRRL